LARMADFMSSVMRSFKLMSVCGQGPGG